LSDKTMVKKMVLTAEHQSMFHSLLMISGIFVRVMH